MIVTKLFFLSFFLSFFHRYPKEQERRRKYGTKREGGWKPIVVYDHDGM